ncbi:gamma-glutamyl kinase [Pelagovum sp. HNIBRBA483]|uniref:gamma-glutamyl kinase n=1 Tax=Pelagovum sp. HNIBRBA483 TaxID=3233341 RepID=UPI0034A58558
MLVFWKENLVFLAVPKTGTTAIEGALSPHAAIIFRDPPILKHVPLYRYRRFVEPLLDKAGDASRLETLAVIRHPLDWLSSWYRYRHREELIGQPNSTRNLSFDEFVLEFCKRTPASFAAVGSQAKFLTDTEDGPGVTHLFQYENQRGLIAFLENRLQRKIDLPLKNVSPKIDLSILPSTVSKLEKSRDEEFEMWENAAHEAPFG